MRELSTGEVTAITGIEGAVFAVIDRKLVRIALPDGAAAELPMAGVEGLLASPDGRWIAASGQGSVSLIDSSGSRTFKIGEAAGRLRGWSEDGTRLAVVNGEQLRVLVRPPGTGEPAGPWRVEQRRTPEALDVGFEGAELVTLNGFGSSGGVVERAGRAQPIGEHRDFGLSVAQGGALVAGRAAGTIAVLRERLLELRAPIGELRAVTAAPHSRFVIAAAPGRVLVWDLEALLPRRRAVADVSVLQGAGGHEVLLGDGARRWQWLDVDTGAATPFAVPFGPYAAHASEDGGLVALLSDPRGALPTSSDAAGGVAAPAVLLVSRKNPRPAALRGELTGLMLLEDRAIAGTAEGAVLEITLGAAGPVSLIERAAAVQAVAAAGAWRSARFADGGLWRRRGEGAAEQLPLTASDVTSAARSAASSDVSPAARSAAGSATSGPITLTQDLEGRVCTSAGARLQCWEPSGVLVTLATLPKPIQQLARFGPWLVAALADGSVYRVALAGDRLEAAPLTGSLEAAAWAQATSATSSDRRDARGDDLVAARQPDGTLAILDVTANAAFRLPFELPPRAPLALARDGSRLSVLLGATLLTWRLDLPRDAAATARWLDALSNASESLGRGRLQWR